MLEKTDLRKTQNNVFDLIGKQWMLITAGNMDSFNTMTASWGGLGVLWNKNVATIYIRPQRYTLQFVEENEFFTLSFFDEAYRDVLRYCGSHSGREVDKIKETGIVPFETENGSVAFKEARMVVECKKVYADRIREKYITDNVVKSLIYQAEDYHYFFIGEITGCLIQK
jgi:flavin reductase (DIM6/NTAB) family NADH-FMN oxidoreductase RutF